MCLSSPISAFLLFEPIQQYHQDSTSHIGQTSFTWENMFIFSFFLLFGIFLLSRAASDSNKVLILMVDNRPLNRDFETNLSESYATRAAAMNYEYAQRNGYSFALIRPEEMVVTKELQQKYGLAEDEIFKQQDFHLKTHVGWAPANKSKAASFNVELKQFRASPWSRLPVIWFISKLVQYVHHSKENDESKQFYAQHSNLRPLMRDWKYILYMDSDMVVNPSFHSVSLKDNVDIWRTHPTERECGQFDDTSVIFFSNAPFNRMPCTGAVVIDVEKPHTSDMFNEWWNHNNLGTNWVHEYEQEALAYLWIQPKRYTFKAHSTYLHQVTQFVPCIHQYFCHVSTGKPADRINYFMNFTHNVLNWTQSIYSAKINEIERNHVFSLSLLPITELMAVRNETLLHERIVAMGRDKNSFAHWLLHYHRHNTGLMQLQNE